MRFAIALVLGLMAVACGPAEGVAAESASNAAHASQFGKSQIATADGQQADAEFFLSNDTCAVCHPRQAAELKGAMHSATHNDPLYRGFAEAARQEAGAETYAYCAACHAPVGVVSGAIPATPEDQLSAEIKAGVTCDTCHHITKLAGAEGRWKEEGNASFVLDSGKVRFGPSKDAAPNRLHTDEQRDFFAKSELCASCHTVIHPENGLAIEGTYDEWKKSVYAEKNIQCQDCHMVSVEDAVKVAETLKPIVRQGQSAVEGPQRTIHPHFFVGGNADADRLAGGEEHAKMAEARLRSAAELKLKVPASVNVGAVFPVDVAVRNVGAGHNIPTGVTELRQVWVELRVLDQNGREVFQNGRLDKQGELAADTVWFGAVATDAMGKPTLKPWEMTRFLKHRTIPPKQTAHEKILVKLPAGKAGPMLVQARLLYRSASPKAVAEFLGDKAYVPKVTEMAHTDAKVNVP